MKNLLILGLFTLTLFVSTSGCQVSWETQETIKSPLSGTIKLETEKEAIDTTKTKTENQVSATKESENLEEKVPESKIYQSKKLGIKFICYDNCKDKLTVEENKIFNKAYYIKIFNKEKETSVEKTILNIIQKEGKDISKCKVVKKYPFWGNKNYDVYVLDLVDSNIEYTEEELAEIETAEQNAMKDGGPFNGEWQKKAIYNRRLVEACSYYAEPLGLSTSKSMPSRFIYNKKSIILFLPGEADQPFYKEDSIELIY